MQWPAVIFLHIPKTAGTAIIETLQAKLSEESFRRVTGDPDRLDPQPSGWERHRFIAGHFTLGHAQRFPGERLFATVLREPGARAASLLSHIEATPDHPLNREVHGRGLVEAIEGSSRFRGEVCDRQCAILTGDEASSAAALDVLLRERWIVGTSPQMVFDRLCRALGLAPGALPWRNVGAARPPLTEHERAFIDGENQQDRRLTDLLTAAAG